MAVSLVGLHCRTSDRTAAAERGVTELETLVAKRLGREPRAIGCFSGPRESGWEDDLRDGRGCLLEAGGPGRGRPDRGQRAGAAGGRVLDRADHPARLHRHRPDAKVLWLDAHGDFNTPDTSPSGYLGGMSLAGACGRWDAGLVPDRADPAKVVLAGVRALDPPEREALEAGSVTVIGASPVETLVAVSNALDRAPVYVHLDLDVIDPEEMPAQFPEPEGLAAEKLFDVLEAVAETSELVGLEVTCFESPDDPEERARWPRP